MGSLLKHLSYDDGDESLLGTLWWARALGPSNKTGVFINTFVVPRITEACFALDFNSAGYVQVI